MLCRLLGDWSSGMIPASGAGGREFDSRITPFCTALLFFAKHMHSNPWGRETSEAAPGWSIATLLFPGCTPIVWNQATKG